MNDDTTPNDPTPNDPTPNDPTPNDPTPNDPGQSTAEYALVMLGAALIALVLISWATGGGGGRIAGLLDHVFDSIEGRLP